MKTGDRVRLLANAEDRFLRQSEGGDGTVVLYDTAHPGWAEVVWDNEYVNYYPYADLEIILVACLPEPEFTLAEINQGSELYTKLEGGHHVKRA